MIPIFQTRHATETFGNCFEACIASILELPLSAVPDRAALVDQDAWADRVSRIRLERGEAGVLDLTLPDEYEAGEDALRRWLGDRGLHWLDLDLEDRVGGLKPAVWLDVAGRILEDGYWIGHTRTTRNATLHATVWQGGDVVHNPSRNGPIDAEALGTLLHATVLVAGNPALLARTLEPLPDVAGAVEAIA